MNILQAIKKEQSYLGKQVADLQAKFNKLGLAAEALNGTGKQTRHFSGGPLSGAGPKTKRRMSAAARARIGAATKKRWAEFRKKKNGK